MIYRILSNDQCVYIAGLYPATSDTTVQWRGLECQVQRTVFHQVSLVQLTHARGSCRALNGIHWTDLWTRFGLVRKCSYCVQLWSIRPILGNAQYNGHSEMTGGSNIGRFLCCLIVQEMKFSFMRINHFNSDSSGTASSIGHGIKFCFIYARPSASRVKVGLWPALKWP